MTSSNDSSVHSVALTEENQADLLDIGLFLLDDPDSANMVVSPVGVAAAAGVIAVVALILVGAGVFAVRRRRAS